MKKFIFYMTFFASLQGWGQTDTLFEENYRELGNTLFQNLDENIYGPSLLNRSFSTSRITWNQINGNYNQTHSIIEFFELYQDLAYSYIDSNKLMNTENLANFITNEFELNESYDTIDRLIQPFGFLLHNVSFIDSSKLNEDYFTTNNYHLIPTGNENELYSQRVFKSGTLIEFYPESGYKKGMLKYTPELISTSDDITNLELKINVGSGFVPFNSSNNFIEYQRIKDSLVGRIAFSYELNDVTVFDTITFFLTTKGEGQEKSNQVYWDAVTHFNNSTSVEFDIGTLLGCGNDTRYARRPIIMVQPYRPTIQPFSMQKYFDQFNFSNLLTDLSDRGYDVFFIKLKPGNASLETAAQALSEYIDLINANKAQGFPNEHWENTLVGFSMGGQIVRCCLKKMEMSHMLYGTPHHHTRLYIPYDSPHLGANIPMFTQSVYYDLKNSNLFAALAYLSLVDEASKDMSISHILASNITQQGNSNVFLMSNDITAERAAFVGALNNDFNHQFTPVNDMRRSFPTFTRNIAVSTGRNDADYNSEYTLTPGKLLFKQDAITLGWGVHYKNRRLYSSKYGDQETVFRNEEKLIFFLPITIRDRDYRMHYAYEWDMAQGGYKDEFFDKIPTGAVFALRTSAWFEGQKYYDKHMSFLPMVSALAINPTIWHNNNIFYNLKDEGLMFRSKIDFDNDVRSDLFGYPNLAHPTNHFDITPFEAAYCDPQTYEHIKMQASVDENNGYSSYYLETTRDFILDEVEATHVYLQNKIIGKNHKQNLPLYKYRAWYKAKDILTIGHLVTPKTDPGDYVIESTGDITVYAGNEINIKPGFHAQNGSDFHAFIKEDCRETAGKSTNDESSLESDPSIIQTNAQVRSTEVSEENHFDFEVYPNPTFGNLTIRNNNRENLTGLVIDITGRVTIDIKSLEPQELFQIILEKGTYYVSLVNQNGERKTKKIIVL